MIRNVVVHVSNEQPLLTDLFDVPSASDAGLLCTNLRMMDGKRPIFIDRVDNTFFFPYHIIRFLEIPVGAIERHTAEADGGAPTTRGSADTLGGAELESRLPAVVEAEAEELESDLGEIDEDFLRRIRDI
ncbi:MAG TPA: hypothetical protein VIR16_04395 [Candidatus Limnocylindrales bacterium]